MYRSRVFSPVTDLYIWPTENVYLKHLLTFLPRLRCREVHNYRTRYVKVNLTKRWLLVALQLFILRSPSKFYECTNRIERERETMLLLYADPIGRPSTFCVHHLGSTGSVGSVPVGSSRISVNWGVVHTLRFLVGLLDVSVLELIITDKFQWHKSHQTIHSNNTVIYWLCLREISVSWSTLLDHPLSFYSSLLLNLDLGLQEITNLQPIVTSSVVSSDSSSTTSSPSFWSSPKSFYDHFTDNTNCYTSRGYRTGKVPGVQDLEEIMDRRKVESTKTNSVTT